jgi:UDP-4-amino-4,6-dideoxy-N-acetyl-beta-L-altrosamine N-acetyltransferase
MLRTYKLLPLIDLGKEVQLQILKIRNEKHIREWMFTQGEIKEEDHFAWIERLKEDKSQFCLVVINENSQPIGSVNLKKISIENKSAELGFYKSKKNEEKGLMIKSLCTIINYSFDQLGLEKIYTEVFEGNIKSLNLHKKLKFTEEGYLRSHIIVKEKRIGVHLFGLLKSEWQVNRNEIKIPEGVSVSLI